MTQTQTVMEEHSGTIKDFPRSEERAKKNPPLIEMTRWTSSCCVVTPVRVQSGFFSDILKEGAYYHITGITVATAPWLGWLGFSINRASFVFALHSGLSALSHHLQRNEALCWSAGPDGPEPKLKREASGVSAPP